jgi:tetratricopeptide (TPR) repeat protein
VLLEKSERRMLALQCQVFVYACTAIAHAMLAVEGRVDTAQAYGQSRTCVRRAIEFDEALSEAQAALSLSETFCDLNLANAVWHGQRAVELNPESAIARYAYAQTLSACGRLDEAIQHAEQGCALDPLMTPINYCYGLLLYYQRRWYVRRRPNCNERWRFIRTS